MLAAWCEPLLDEQAEGEQIWSEPFECNSECLPVAISFSKATQAYVVLGPSSAPCPFKVYGSAIPFHRADERDLYSRGWTAVATERGHLVHVSERRSDEFPNSINDEHIL